MQAYRVSISIYGAAPGDTSINESFDTMLRVQALSTANAIGILLTAIESIAAADDAAGKIEDAARRSSLAEKEETDRKRIENERAEEKQRVADVMPSITASAEATREAIAAGEKVPVFDLFLINAGERKINIIREVRSASNLGLKEARDLVEESGPTTVKIILACKTFEYLIPIVQTFLNNGAVVDVQPHKAGNIGPGYV